MLFHIYMKNSDINECASWPCENSGVCDDNVDGYTCQCDRNYVGTHCESGMMTATPMYSTLVSFAHLYAIL